MLADLARGQQPRIDVEPACRSWLSDRKIDSLLDLGRRSASERQRVYDALWEAQRQALAEILEEVARRGVEPIVFKGAAFHLEHFGTHAIGQMNDLDLLVSPADLEVVRGCLLRLGYDQSVFDRDRLVPVPVAERQAHEAGHYELFPFRRLDPMRLKPSPGTDYLLPVFEIEGALYASVGVDLHHAVATNIPATDLFPRAATGRDGSTKTLSPADHLWFSTSRYYTEVATNGKRSLRDFAYLIPLLRGGAIDWQVVLGEAERYALHPALFYYLWFMNWLGDGELVPPRVLDALDPRHGHRRRDWGWQLGVLFDAHEPFPFA